MRDLIKPTLFIFARTGLFFAVVAWIAGLWIIEEDTAFEVRRTFVKRSFRCAFHADGWEVETRDYPYVILTSDFPMLENIGVMACVFEGGFWTMFDHLLPVTIFAGCNGVLIWVYRKRPEVQLCEI